MGGGTKLDTEKNDLSLLAPEWIFGTGRILTFGKRKYAAWNWAKGIQLSRLLAACLRHIFAFLSGEDRDPETGECHLYHASCCLMFASEMWRTRPDMDDRYRPSEKGCPERENPALASLKKPWTSYECPGTKHGMHIFEGKNSVCQACGVNFSLELPQMIFQESVNGKCPLMADGKHVYDRLGNTERKCICGANAP